MDELKDIIEEFYERVFVILNELREKSASSFPTISAIEKDLESEKNDS